MFRPQTIRAKLLLILLGLCALVAGAFAVYLHSTSARYRELRSREMVETVAFESERVARIISEMDRNAIDLALAGQQYYDARISRPDGVRSISGEVTVVRNFISFPNAVGGGIWYEPFTFSNNIQRLAFYAYRDRDSGLVRPDPSYTSPQYDYPNQMWYRAIAAELKQLSISDLVAGRTENPPTAWTVPYYDEAGTRALMTTVGAGIYDATGTFVGMSTVDWEIESVVDRLTAIQPTEGSFVLLAAPASDRVIADTAASSMDGEVLSDLAWVNELPTNESDEVSSGTVVLSGIPYLTFSRRFDNGWLFSVQIPQRELFADIDARNLRFSLALGTALACALAGTWLLMSRLVTRPVHSLANQVVTRGASGDLDTPVSVSSHDEIGMLAGAFNEMTVALKGSISQRVAALAEQERMGTELSVAHDIQAAILPHTFPAFPDREDFDVYACMYPQREIGGDFYDFFLIDDNTLAVVIADVSGKGVPAALFMMSARTLIHNTLRSNVPPERALEIVNDALCDNNDSAMFVTAFIACLDLTSGLVRYANAGHNPPIVIRRATGAGSADPVTWLEVTAGFVLGGVPDLTFASGQLQLCPGDALLLYTDGVTEALNPENDLYGEQRLIRAVTATRDLRVIEQCEAIRADVNAFVRGAEPADDLTMLLVRYDGPAETPATALRELIVPADTDQLDAVQDFVSETLRSNACPDVICNQVLVAVEELFVNIVSYSSDELRDEGSTNPVDVSIRCGIAGQAAVVELADAGKPFNPLTDAPVPNTSASVEERPIGGLGIFMARSLMTTMDYQFVDGRNVVTMTKEIAKEDPCAPDVIA